MFVDYASNVGNYEQLLIFWCYGIICIYKHVFPVEGTFRIIPWHILIQQKNYKTLYSYWQFSVFERKQLPSLFWNACVNNELRWKHSLSTLNQLPTVYIFRHTELSRVLHSNSNRNSKGFSINWLFCISRYCFQNGTVSSKLITFCWFLIFRYEKPKYYDSGYGSGGNT